MIRLLLTGAGLRVLALLASAAIGFFLTPFMIHRLGDQLYGLWVLVASFSATYNVLDLGLSSAVGRFAAVAVSRSDYDGMNRYVNTALVIYCGLGAAVLGAAGVLTFWASTFANTPEEIDLLTVLIVIVGTEFALSFPLRAIAGAVGAKLRFDVISGIQIGFRVLSAAITVLVLLAGHGLITLALVGLALGILRGVVWFLAVRRVIPQIRIAPRMATRTAAGALFSFGVFTFIAQVGDMVRFRIDNFVIGGFLGAAAITHYAIGAILVGFYQKTVAAIMGVLNPVFAQLHGQNDLAAMQRTVLLGMRVAVSLACFIAFGLIAWGAPFIERWMGPAYLDAYPCLVVLCSALTLAFWQSPSYSAVCGRAQHQGLSLLIAAESVANLICSLIFVRMWGILGVALGTALPMVVVKLTLQPWITCRVMQIPIPRYVWVLSRAVLNAILSLLIPAALTYWLIRPTYASLLLTGVLSAAAYFPIVGMLNLTAGERTRILAALLPKPGTTRTES